MRATTASLAAAALLLGQASAALPPIVQKGTKFFYENGTQFFMKGVAYQREVAAGGAPTNGNKYSDPLADVDACKRDIPLLAALKTNTIRTYAIDPTADHSECMALLDKAGIYVISDLSEPALSIETDNPRWDVDIFERYKAVIDELAQYSNVIGFFAGNEVTTNSSNTPASAYVKAAVRDTKAHIKKNHKRWLGVGYAANDDAEIRVQITHYFNCGPQEEAIDYWGYNIYQWCGESTIEKSGYGQQVEFFKNYSVPVFFGEYGCNIGGAAKRIWQETTALYSKEMTDVFSGGIVFKYFQEENDYGIVSIKNEAATKMPDYAPLSTRMASVNPSSTSSAAYTPTNTPQECPEVSDVWQVKGDALPPTPDKNLCDCMFKSLTCVPKKGLDTEDYGEIFGYICGADPKACAGIVGHTENGVYGAYAGCSSTHQLGYVLDRYYKNQNSAATACDFDGKAVVTSAATVNDNCKASLASASSANEIAATATSGSSSASSSSFASPIAQRHFFTIGDMVVGLYVAIAMGVGAGMVML